MGMSSIYVQISWPVDASANYFPLDSYKVLIETITSGVFAETTVYCDASNSIIFIQRYCLVPMNILREAPFSLTYGLPVKAKLQAHNERGWSADSATTTGPTIQTEPV